MNYLTHITKPGAIIIYEVRVKSLGQLQHPCNVSELRFFLRLCNPYWRFVPNYTNFVAPLTKILEKWQPKGLQALNDHESQAFDEHIKTVSSKEVLVLPSPDLPFVIGTDANDYQLGAVLFQVYTDGDRKPIRFCFRSISSDEKN